MIRVLILWGSLPRRTRAAEASVESVVTPRIQSVSGRNHEQRCIRLRLDDVGQLHHGRAEPGIAALDQHGYLEVVRHPDFPDHLDRLRIPDRAGGNGLRIAGPGGCQSVDRLRSEAVCGYLPRVVPRTSICVGSGLFIAVLFDGLSE
jgi:hypothetical protein